jgi:signal transduction histidine kinase
VNCKLAKSRSHWVIMISLAATIWFGYFAEIVRDYNLAMTFFLLSCVAYVFAMIGCYQFNMYVTQLPVAPSTYDLHTVALDELQFYTAIKNIRILVVFIMPSFPIIYIIAMMHWIDVETAWKALIIANVASKVGYLSVVCDSQIQLVDSKVTAKAAIASAIVTKAEVLRYVFHEIRNPLNSLSVGLDLISHSSNLSSIDVKALSLMNESTSYMTDTLNNVLYIQMIDDGALTLNNRPINFKQLFYDVKSSLASRSVNQEVHILVNYDSAAPSVVIGDRHQLQVAFTNIISQLMKFCKKNSVLNVDISTNDAESDSSTKTTPLSRRIESSLSLSSTTMRACVRNTGMHSPKPTPAVSERILTRFYIKFDEGGNGISDEDLAVLLQPFNRLRGADASSGLALTLARAIIEIHGGEILKQTIKDSVGARISISIPFEISTDDKIPVSQESSDIMSDDSDDFTLDDHDEDSVAGDAADAAATAIASSSDSENENPMPKEVATPPDAMKPILSLESVASLSSFLNDLPTAPSKQSLSPEKPSSAYLYPDRLNLFVSKAKSSGSVSNASSFGRLPTGLPNRINHALVVDGKIFSLLSVIAR